MIKKLVICGSGGAASEALWVCRRINEAGTTELVEVLGFTDDRPERTGAEVEGLPILGTTSQIAQRFGGQGVYFHCAIGDNRARHRVSLELVAGGFTPLSLIDPSAIVAPTATVGAGTYIGPLSLVAPHAQVGRFVLINTHVSIGHHAVVGNFAQFCPGSRPSGLCQIGEGAFMGSNAAAAPKVRIGAWATLGAASFALKDVPDATTAIGNPARVVLR